MRGRERRVADAVSAHIVRTGRMPAAVELAEVVGVAAGAAGCALLVAGERHGWGRAEGPWAEFPVEYDGETQGVVAITPVSVGSLAEVARALGPVIAAIRAGIDTDRLRRDGDAAARRLVDDRWRAAAEMERERRGLERDLHDGAQHHLVALQMSLALAAHVEGTPVTDLLDRLDAAERVLLDTASGVLPVALVTDGLGAALSDELSGHADVTLDVAGLRHRYPPSIESTVFFLCLEAVNNAHKHAPGARITVTAGEQPRGVAFTVTDTGPGFDTTAPNAGLHNLSARAAAVGGTVEVRSTPGQGTTVSGFVPW
ncbi:sensor histidine kinase [Actinokineospora sp. UTMC 2448]|uniref:sensor histidine kinase n=1 Tax=Actinokineospora sp. UTMC 2448 TaxID=2268449 RepID=UPI0021646912|nr:ATP-binding protein [Actinokineospora sp. UTMC 2448]